MKYHHADGKPANDLLEAIGRLRLRRRREHVRVHRLPSQERSTQRFDHSLNMYPRLRMVMMLRGLLESISIFSRSQRICTLIVCCSPSKSYPQTLSSNVWRVMTRPRFSMSTCRSEYALGASATSDPRTVSDCREGSSVISPMVNARPASEVPVWRRKRAFTRAKNS